MIRYGRRYSPSEQAVQIVHHSTNHKMLAHSPPVKLGKPPCWRKKERVKWRGHDHREESGDQRGSERAIARERVQIPCHTLGSIRGDKN